ncbi:hypothetical protein B0H12DRAFT_1239623 [Mycena haematopus]|nr:hypothetical protein B0H12DRAFT_1239623 [Mycena haematopus]
MYHLHLFQCNERAVVYFPYYQTQDQIARVVVLTAILETEIYCQDENERVHRDIALAAAAVS